VTSEIMLPLLVTMNIGVLAGVHPHPLLHGSYDSNHAQ